MATATQTPKASSNPRKRKRNTKFQRPLNRSNWSKILKETSKPNEPTKKPAKKKQKQDAPAEPDHFTFKFDPANPPKNFSALPLSTQTRTALEEMKFEEMWPVQSESIPHLLNGTDLLGSAKTGSGKTLAFLVPAVELLNRLNYGAKEGTGVLVIAPTRELAIQIYGVCQDLAKYHKFTTGLVIGGNNRQTEYKHLQKGVNLLIGTPGRLLDHLQNSSGFVFKHLKMLIIDEADRILDIGFEQDLRLIIQILPKNRQTVLFSATQTENIEDLARLAINKKPHQVHVDAKNEVATVEGLEQGYVVCSSDMRFMLLFTFLKKMKNKKIMVFFSTCNSVKFHAELFNYIDLHVMDIHGKHRQSKRTQTFFQFCNADSGVLLATDVAARGLDIPEVDWIVQYDPPDDPKEYIHRVGRTARAGKKGRALMFLLPQELGFLKYLRQHKVPISEYEFPSKKVSDVQAQMEKLIEKNFYLHKASIEAYRSYILGYNAHSLKEIFNVHKLDLVKVAKSFGFSVPPRIDLTLSYAGDKKLNKRSRKQSD